VSQYVDQRVRVTDVRAETALTRDTVPVNVDAIVFWVVWNAEKAILEVMNFGEAVKLSAADGARESIGRHELAQMDHRPGGAGQGAPAHPDEKTNPWGITVQSVEIRDVQLPKELEDAMSRRAQAERERQRVTATTPKGALFILGIRRETESSLTPSKSRLAAVGG